MEEGEVSRGEAEGREGENKAKGRKPRPGSSWPRPQLSRVEFTRSPCRLRQHTCKSQNALEGQCSLLTVAVRLFRCKQPCTTQQASVHTCAQYSTL